MRVRVSPAQDGALLEVEDTGPGIPEAARERIFEPFEQLEPAHQKSKTGLGLGLALVRQMVQTLGGSIELQTREGHGSTFRVHLPDVPLSKHPEPR